MKRTPIRKRRGVRKGPWRSASYRRWIASQPCEICGSLNVQAAHTEHGGMSQKGSDASCIPLCVIHHDQLDGRAPMYLYGRHVVSGMKTKQVFESIYSVSLDAAATRHYQRWMEMKGKAA